MEWNTSKNKRKICKKKNTTKNTEEHKKKAKRKKEGGQESRKEGRTERMYFKCQIILTVPVWFGYRFFIKTDPSSPEKQPTYICIASCCSVTVTSAINTNITAVKCVGRHFDSYFFTWHYNICLLEKNMTSVSRFIHFRQNVNTLSHYRYSLS